ncbi:MAG TPA: PAS domain S-box protein, partial [Rhizobium sp.]|nr:PAS domain S-box protein [Rhizobium sp.]
SGVRAAASMAAALDRQLSQKQGRRSIRLYIVDSIDNRTVFHRDYPAGERIPFPFIEQMFRQEEGVFQYVVNGSPRYAVFTSVQPVGWLIGLSIGKEEMLEQRGFFLREIGAITLLVLCLNALIVSLFGRRLLKRIDTTIDCVSRIERGDLAARIDAIPVRDEIGRLQEGVNAMGKRIEQRTLEQKAAEQAVRDREIRIRRLVDSNIIGVFFWDMHGAIPEANDAFLSMIGYERDDISKGVVQWNRLTPDEFSEIDAGKVAELRRSHSCAPYEKEFIRKDGSRVPVMLGAAMFEGQEETGVAFVLDLTERKRADAALRKAHDELELRVQERTADLKQANRQLEVEIQERRQAQEVLAQQSRALARSNAELEQLAYVASHDLQEPLRMIASYLQLLETRYRGMLDDNGVEFINFAVDGAKRMQCLIDDLLSFSRVGTKAVTMEPTDSANTVAVVLHTLHIAIQECGAKIRCSHLPVVMADPTQLAQLFQNLIANGLKFHGAAAPEISIDAVPDGDFWRFSVKDNGIGIAPEHFDRIFVMFQRLHARREYPGTGIG